MLQTSRGPLYASGLVIATNAYTAGLVGRLSRSVLRIQAVQLATEPIPYEVRRTILPAWQSCSDNHADIRYFRWDPAGRFALGGPGWFMPPRSANAMSLRRLERSLRERFPQLRPYRVTHRWFGAGAITFDRFRTFTSLGQASLGTWDVCCAPLRLNDERLGNISSTSKTWRATCV